MRVRDVPYIIEKLSMRATTLLKTSPQSDVCTQKIMGLQSHKNPNFGKFGTKRHLGATFVAKHRKYYKWEGGGFPQVWAMVSLVNMCMFMARLCTKSATTTH